jgi:para-nitrobenzyl esterase
MIVRTTAGEVRGEPIATGVRFRGIPYAAAPEGDLRFAEPAPPPAGDGVRDAREPGPTAPQRQRETPGVDLSSVVGTGWRPGPEY